jgi:hypothetical protein
MPFETRFAQIADLLKDTVTEVLNAHGGLLGPGLPHIVRLDWITASGAIHQQLWEEVTLADLVFADITGYNPNVMFEAGVSAAWKPLPQVVLLKDRFFKQPSAFDIAPIRYIEYEMTSDGRTKFQADVAKLVSDVVIAFPDSRGTTPPIELPLVIDFANGRDDERLHTPPFAHRRVIEGRLEFGSRTHFSHSWASIGKARLATFDLTFLARFSNRVEGYGYIGVGVRSQHYFANFAHILYLNYNGEVILTQPNEVPPHHYTDIKLRDQTKIDYAADHEFHVSFDAKTLKIRVDDFETERDVAQMPKVLGAGLIRFQSHMSWMAIKQIRLEAR